VPLYLGFDCSTQSLTAIVLEIEGDRKRVVFESALSFDADLPHYGTHHGVLPDDDPSVALSSPAMWTEALDVMVARLATSGLDTRRLAAVSGSAQQHGSVYMNAAAAAGLSAFDPDERLVKAIGPLLSRPVAPIWMDSSTTVECAELSEHVGGADVLAQKTGSRAFERFTGPQIRKLYKRDPATYAATDRIHLVSSFLASLLVGRHAPIDTGDGSGMNLMELASWRWWPPALLATAPGLSARLPALVPSATVVGHLSPYWQGRYDLPPAKVVAWSGDNPSSLIGTGLVAEGRAAVSLGTSDTIFGVMNEPRVDATGTGHVFGAPTGAYMGLTVFRNGSLARERVRQAFGLTWREFSQALDRTPAGNGGRILLPWFEPEITPHVPAAGVRRYGLDEHDGPGNVRAVVEGQQMALALHSRWMGVDIRTIHATGGAAANRAILQVMADVFGADVYQFEVGNSACLGAALRAYQGDTLAGGISVPWDEIISGLAEPVAASLIAPGAGNHAMYQALMRTYEAYEVLASRESRSNA
jgi:xylulokinase